MDKLKNDYKWELHFPELINGFKFNQDMLKSIFDAGLCSNKLNENSSHDIILKSYMNHYFNSEVFTNKNKADHHKSTTTYILNDKFKRIYVLIKNSIYISPMVNDVNIDSIDFV